MKKNLCFVVFSFCLLVLCAPSLLAQQALKVSVTFGNDPLEFAYVSINGKFCTSPDAIGNAEVPKSLLHLGDTLSASVVWMQRSVIYQDVHTSQLVIDLKDALLPSGGQLTSPRFSERYFKEYIHMPDIGQYFTQYEGDFDVVCPDKSKVTGKFVKHNVLKPDLAYRGTPEVLVRVRSGVRSDRTSELLAASSATAYESVASLFEYYDLIVRYLGEHGSTRRFLVTRLSDVAGMKNLQILLSVDAFFKRDYLSNIYLDRHHRRDSRRGGVILWV
jgi:hypothetical protein